MSKIAKTLDMADKFVKNGQMKLARAMAKNIIAEDKKVIGQLALKDVTQEVLDSITYLSMVYGRREVYQMR